MSLSTPFLDSSSSSSKGVKRKWSLRDGSTDFDPEAELPFCHSPDHSSSSSDSKASSATMSSVIESDEESSMEIELDFTLHLGHEKTPLKKKHSSFNNTSLDLQDQVDLELTLSSTPTSSITTWSVITHQQERIISTKVCQYNGCEKQPRGVSVSSHCTAHRDGRNCKNCKGHGRGKRCKFEGCGKSAQGSTDFCKVHGALVKDERVHGGATLGPLVHDTKSGPLGKGSCEDMNVDGNVVTSSRVSEGRVHGGSLIAILAGNSVGLLDSGKVNMGP